jgi:hypothetical protein
MTRDTDDVKWRIAGIGFLGLFLVTGGIVWILLYPKCHEKVLEPDSTWEVERSCNHPDHEIEKFEGYLICRCP